MNDLKIIRIQKKSEIIPIPQKSLKNETLKNETIFSKEYSLKNNFFDPSKSSPPNEFMIKLNMRMNIHNNYLFNSKDDNLLIK
jgi:hypothetical protein